MIPKIIHYCWFGGTPMPENDARYVAGWKRMLPGYKFIFWNESNFDVNGTVFTRQVAEAKKWGFIVDYIRAWAVYHYGGIYLDTDVELLKPLDGFLHNVCFAGFENEQHINPGSIFAGEQHCVIAKELMDFYERYNFIALNGEPNLTPSPVIFTEMLVRHGLRKDNAYQNLDFFTAYPSEYFCPQSIDTGILAITANTHSIHHYDASWVPENERFYYRIKRELNRLLGRRLGTLLSFPVFVLMNIRNYGLAAGINRITNKLKSVI